MPMQGQTWGGDSDCDGEKPLGFRHMKEGKVTGFRGKAEIPGYTSGEF